MIEPAADSRIQWFQEARFGLFVHWGMYSVLGRGEQIMARDLMPSAEYERYAAEFRPAPDWAERLAERAVRAGARYVVVTTRHHDGYCLFDTATTDFNAARTGPGRDLISEYVQALRKAGLRIGFYYSLLNWRRRCFWSPDAYADDLPRMVEQVHAQVRELMSRYGPVDILWYDAPALPGSAAHGMWGGRPIQTTPAEFWRAHELNAMARRLQPHILINNRSGIPGDFGTPEQCVTADGEGRPWETCMTVNYAPGWGYIRYSLANKTPGEVLFNLMDAVRLGGNFLFNVGPRADGSIDDREGRILDEIGRWMAKHGEAVYGTRPTGVYPLRGRVQGPMYHYGMWTCKGATGYFAMFYYPGSELVISKIAPRPVSARLLGDERPLELVPASNGRTVVKGLPETPPDPLAPVLRVEFEAPPKAVTALDARWLDGTFTPPAGDNAAAQAGAC